MWGGVPDLIEGKRAVQVSRRAENLNSREGGKEVVLWSLKNNMHMELFQNVPSLETVRQLGKGMPQTDAVSSGTRKPQLRKCFYQTALPTSLCTMFLILSNLCEVQAQAGQWYPWASAPGLF